MKLEIRWNRKKYFARALTILGRLLRKRLNVKNSPQAPQTGLTF
jgi:hypothetical protein